MITNPLFDIDFLQKLVSKNEREIYARITALDVNELPIEHIEGKITDGTINVDGKSIIRRTCNLTMVASDVNINEFYWGLRNKFILEIGLKNLINSIYPDIIWFKQGLFVITQFNTTEATNKWTIKIQGKDKMCLLNGEVSGNLPHETDFGKEEYHDLENDTVTYTEIPIKTIIRNIVQEFGRELPQNIIINDIDDAGFELLEYHNQEPAYLYRGKIDNEFKNMTLDGTLPCSYELRKEISIDEYNLIPNDEYYEILRKYYKLNSNGMYQLDENIFSDNEYYNKKHPKEKQGWFTGTVSDNFNIIYDNLLNDVEFDTEPTIIHFPNDSTTQKTFNDYILAKIEYGDTPGYYLTELTYAGDLIGKVGETLTSVLDKIKKMLSNFEYYYDINGKFVFQKRSEYVISPWNSIDNEDQELYTDATINRQNYMFNFVDSVLVSSFQNTPKLTDVKNDYSVWGSYKNNSTEIPIHMRYAIDTKPTEYKPIRPLKEEIITILTNSNGEELNKKISYKYYDAPEIEPYDESELEKITDMNDSKNGFSPSKVTIKLPNGNIQTTIIYPYFAINSYKTESDYIIQYNDLKTLLQFDDITEQRLDQLELAFENQQNLSYGFSNIYDYLKIILPKEQYEVLETKIYTKYGVDWRELIYQMALDYRKCHIHDDFLYYIAQANPQYPSGRTGYEQYYIDLEGFWRTLYDPNPEMIYESLTYDKIKDYSILDDSIDAIDIDKDIIYIKNGYRNIEYEEFTSEDLSPGELYKFNHPINDPTYTALYPFIGSDECHLQFNYNYYLRNDNKMTIKNADSTKSEDYENLNSNALNNIYIKNTQDFIAAADDFLVLEKENNELHEDLLKSFEEQKEENSSDFLDYLASILPKFTNSTYSDFVVPYYPSQGNLETYKDYENQDYLKFIDVCFDNIRNENPNDVLNKYYLKDEGYVKLSNYYKDSYLYGDSQFWNNLYKSNLITYSYDARNIVANFNSLLLSEYDSDKKINYLVDYVGFLKEYIIKMNQYGSSELKNSLSIELNKIIEYYNSIMNSKLFSYISSSPSLEEAYSCLPFLFFDDKNGYVKLINTIYENIQNNPNADLLTRIQWIQNINQYVDFLFKDINNHYVNTKFIETLLDDIKDLETVEEEKAKIIEYRDVLKEKNEKEEFNKDSQQAKTLAQLEYLIAQIEAEELNTIESIQEYVLNYIITPVTLLKDFYDDVDAFIKGKNSVVREVCLLDSFIDFLTLMDKLQELTFLLSALNGNDNFEYDTVFNYITFNRSEQLGGQEQVIFLPVLYTSISTAQSNEKLNENLQKYLKITYDFQEYYITEDINNFNYKTSDKLNYEKINYYKGYYNYGRDQITGNYWTQDLYITPQTLLFWFDFLSPNGAELEKISVPSIGARTKVVNDKNVKAIHYKEVPSVIFKKNTDGDYDRKSGYSYILVNNNTETYFSISSRSKSAKERIDELLYNHAYTPENVSISAIPVYYLEPNHHIFVRDDRSNICGEYVVNKLTIPLNYKKTMTITASKAVSDII